LSSSYFTVGGQGGISITALEIRGGSSLPVGENVVPCMHSRWDTSILEETAIHYVLRWDGKAKGHFPKFEEKEEFNAEFA